MNIIEQIHPPLPEFDRAYRVRGPDRPLEASQSEGVPKPLEVYVVEQVNVSLWNQDECFEGRDWRADVRFIRLDKVDPAIFGERFVVMLAKARQMGLME
jgi:hypothetical protein